MSFHLARLSLLATLLSAPVLAAGATSQKVTPRYPKEPIRLFMVALELPRFQGELYVNGIPLQQVDTTLFGPQQLPPYRVFSPSSVSFPLTPGQNEIRLAGAIASTPGPSKVHREFMLALHGFTQDGEITEKSNQLFQWKVRPQGRDAKVNLRLSFSLSPTKVRWLPW